MSASITSSSSNGTFLTAPRVRSRSEVRDTIESYLTQPTKVDQAKTEYGLQVSGYSDFLADPKFRSVIESHDENGFRQLSHNEKVAYFHITSPVSRANAEWEQIRQGQIAFGMPDPGAIGVASRPFNAKAIGADFEREAKSGKIDFLKTVDREEKAGISTLKWEDQFRGAVTSLDHHFDLMRRSYEAHGQDTKEIQKRYDEVLGGLYDYAVERDKQQTAPAVS